MPPRDAVPMFMQMMGGDGQEPPRMMDEAQILNLTQAWEARVRGMAAIGRGGWLPGQLLRERDGLGYFNDDPVLLYVRPLDPADPIDVEMAKVFLNRVLFPELDSVVARVLDDGTVAYALHSAAHLRAHVGG